MEGETTRRLPEDARAYAAYQQLLHDHWRGLAPSWQVGQARWRWCREAARQVEAARVGEKGMEGLSGVSTCYTELVS
jgi:hypothetical protein